MRQPESLDEIRDLVLRSPTYKVGDLAYWTLYDSSFEDLDTVLLEIKRVGIVELDAEVLMSGHGMSPKTPMVRLNVWVPSQKTRVQ